jgi:CheY-like chemotaxis protein|tara:strand:+ start:192 stop:590 length:399 start_codon:yes stop_codon:yes gene_type:complete
MAKFDRACIIDDDHIYVYGAKRAMLKTNFCNEVVVYSNGLEALTQLELMQETPEKLPEIIFLDINMPILDGWQFLDEFLYLKSSKKSIIYIVTSSENPIDMEKANQYNMEKNYIVKPISVKKLLSLFDLDET